MIACLPHGFKLDPRSMDAPYYALVREIAQAEWPKDWDWDKKLQGALALSRLVHCHSAGNAFRARVTFDGDGRMSEVFPPYWTNDQAYHPNILRNYLKPEEWREVGRLLACYSQSVARKSRRITSAMWFREKAAIEYWHDVAWAFIGSAIDRLVGPDYSVKRWQADDESCAPPERRPIDVTCAVDKPPRRGPANRLPRGKIFKSRLFQLSKFIGHQLYWGDVEDAWDLRSLGAHGECLTSHPMPGDSSDKPIREELYHRVVLLLNAVLRRAIMDDDFALHFESECSVREFLDR